MPQKLAELNIGGDAPQSVLGVGDSGSGKSIAMCSWAEQGPMYVANCDGRMGSVAEWYRGSEIAKNLEFDIFKDYDSLGDKIQGFVEAESIPYKTIMIDPLTNISSFLMRYSFALRGSVEWDEAAGKAVKRGAGKKRGKVDLTSYDDIATEHRGIEDLILDLKVIQEKHKVNIILLAHLLTTTYTKVGGSEGNIRRDIVTAGKKIVPFIPTQFDEVYHFYTEGGMWKVKTYNDGIVAARSSFLMMPPEIDWTKSGSFYDIVSKYYVPSEKVSSNE